MLQVWRLQQVSQIVTLILMAGNLALVVWGLVKWRGEFMGSYYGALVILVLLGVIVYVFALVWDLKLKLWRDQMSVAVEKNPYQKEKLAPKEVVMDIMVWVPILQRLGKDDPEAREITQNILAWVKKAYHDDATLRRDVKDLFGYIGQGQELLDQLEK